MRKLSYVLFIGAIVLMLFSAINLLLADPPGPPSLPGGHGYEENVPAGAPIDGGISLLLVLGLGYGLRVLMIARKKEQ